MLVALRKKLFGSHAVSKKRAKSRLHFVLVQDRTGLNGEEMAKFKQELVAVVEKYFVIDKQGFDVAYKRDTDSTTLLINSPVVVRRQDASGGSVGTERLRKRASAAAAAAAAAEDKPKDDEQPEAVGS